MNSTADIDRYLQVVTWARRRYTYTDTAGRRLCTLTYQGGRIPSRYSHIEDIAAARYLGTARRWPDACRVAAA